MSTSSLSRLGLPYVYIAYSQTAQLIALAEKRYFIFKVGTSVGHPNEHTPDRLNALNGGFLDSATGKRGHPLMNVTDWDFLITTYVDSIADAKEFEKNLQSLFSPDDVKAWVTWSQTLLYPGETHDGIRDIVTMPPSWIREHVQDWKEDMPNLDSVLTQVDFDGLREICMGLGREVFGRSGIEKYGSGGLWHLAEHPDGNVKLADDGPRLKPTATKNENDG